MKKFFEVLDEYFWLLAVLFLGIYSLATQYYTHSENLKDKEIRLMIVKDSLDRL